VQLLSHDQRGTFLSLAVDKKKKEKDFRRTSGFTTKFISALLWEAFQMMDVVVANK